MSEDATLTPLSEDALREGYGFIEPWFGHDLDSVEYGASEFDSRVGMPGLHTVRSEVEAPERKPILPLEIFNRFVPESF